MMMSRHARVWPRWAIGVLLIPGLALLPACTRFGASLDRGDDPVVLTGADVPGLGGIAPSRLVAFAWDGDVWTQVPVQVDERDDINPSTILHRSAPATQPDGSPLLLKFYTPPITPSPGYTWWETYTPPDSDPTLDADDEIVFLGSDVGQRASSDAAPPQGVASTTQTELHVTDPLMPDQDGWVYLYEGTSLSSGSGGTSGVSYTFSLDSGDYRSTYRMGDNALAPNTGAGPNPEHSTVVAPSYTQGFADRWLNSDLTIKTKGSNRADILERSRIQTVPGECGRSEDTFNGAASFSRGGPKAFITNISGPVRGVRSYIGANSGNLTAGTDFFYPRRVDTIFDLRVHTIGGVMNFDDLTTGLNGMRYSDALAPDGVTIDGAPDTLPAGLPAWQMVSGPQGSLVTVRTVNTTIPGLPFDRWYLDDTTPSDVPCTGDAVAWGQHGAGAVGPLPCTDPRFYGIRSNCPARAGQPTVDVLQGSRVRYFRAPGLGADDAGAPSERASASLEAEVTSGP
jgi:hypothetical protein